ncbi:MAG: hypothetical protein FWE19_00155 [Oscillospiraceae bacterium]|nr:hypothetical protein [Oscillospiraceae bacterium]
MPYESMLEILEEARDLLGVLFEHGLASTGPISKELEEQSRTFALAGLEHGGKLLADLAGELTATRLNSAGDYERAVALLTELWRYIAACLYRLDFVWAQSDCNTPSAPTE